MSSSSDLSRRRVTVKDVARVAGVSAGTVSNAISGKRRVDAETRERIDRAIAELGYVPNLAARGMRTGRANTIAIFSSMPTAVAAGKAKLGFLMEIAAAAAVTALERNVALVLVPPIKDPSTALSTIPFDGAVLVEPAADDPYLDMLRNRGLPSVVIGPPPDEKDPWIRVDNHQIAELLVDHMIEVGATNFPLLVGRSMRRSNVIFRETYVARCSAAGLPVRIIEIDETDAENAAEAAILREIDEGTGLDGVVASIDATASGAMTALRARGLSVPEDVKVVTRYDGFRARSENPSLTALNLRLDEIAQLAANSLLDVLEGKELSGPIDAPPPLLVVRGSTVKGM